jgi:bacterioferritin-associated ferredoxin
LTKAVTDEEIGDAIADVQVEARLKEIKSSF